MKFFCCLLLMSLHVSLWLFKSLVSRLNKTKACCTKAWKHFLNEQILLQNILPSKFKTFCIWIDQLWLTLLNLRTLWILKSLINLKVEGLCFKPEKLGNNDIFEFVLISQFLSFSIINDFFSIIHQMDFFCTWDLLVEH